MSIPKNALNNLLNFFIRTSNSHGGGIRTHGGHTVVTGCSMSTGATCGARPDCANPVFYQFTCCQRGCQADSLFARLKHAVYYRNIPAQYRVTISEVASEVRELPFKRATPAKTSAAQGPHEFGYRVHG